MRAIHITQFLRTFHRFGFTNDSFLFIISNREVNLIQLYLENFVFMEQAQHRNKPNGIRMLSLFGAFFWIVLCMGILLLKFYFEIKIPWLILIYCSFTIVCSLISFVAYGIDKRRARKNQFRISEKKLHLLSLLGGWPGSYLAQQLFRHKTQKVSFRFVFWVIVFFHAGIIGYGIFIWIKMS
jgi:uncharacterized membrane protein YsdA (DUF1294 family)